MLQRLADTFTLTVIIKMLWFSFIALLPCWVGVVAWIKFTITGEKFDD